MPVFNRYSYQPLQTKDAVRLIVLDTALNDQASLSCFLVQNFPAQHHNYNAISYVWGEQDTLSSQTLEIRHDDDTSYLRITPNVDTVLRRFRAANKPQYLWLDAICLNQDDETEKAQQVPLMGRIYGQAEGVHIWLGPHDYATSRLFKFFRKACNTHDREQSQLASKLAALMRKTLPNDGPSGLGCVHKFFERRWFSRRWVIQEASLAQSAIVHCGRHSIPLQVLSLAARQFQALDISSYPIRMATKLCNSTKSLGMLELLWDFHEAGCEDPRDRIAALLGLLPEDSRVPMDYTLPWFEIYRQLAAFILEHGSDKVKLQVLLHLFEFGPVSVPGGSYPSWVPDWSQRRRRTLPFHSFIREVDTYEAYPASPGYPPLSTLTLQDRILRISWDMGLGGPSGLRVKSTTDFRVPAETKKTRAKRVIKALEGLFPNVPYSAPDILVLASLVKVAVGFRWTREPALESQRLDEYLGTIRQFLPDSSNFKLLDSLKHLDHLLREFSLFSLEPLRSGLGLRFYGIGSLQLELDDIMVPVWYPGWDSDRRFGIPGEDVEETAVNAITMLVVRRVDDGQQVSWAIKGKVIGPAICVVEGDTQERRTGWLNWMNSLVGTEMGRQYIIQLV